MRPRPGLPGRSRKSARSSRYRARRWRSPPAARSGWAKPALRYGWSGDESLAANLLRAPIKPEALIAIRRSAAFPYQLPLATHALYHFGAFSSIDVVRRGRGGAGGPAGAGGRGAAGGGER